MRDTSKAVMKKENFLKIIALFLSVAMVSSCATILSKKQEVTVTSDVYGAKVYKGKKYVGTTPLTFKTKKAKSTFTVEHPDYGRQTINTDVDIRWNTLWNYFNGFFPGWFIDLACGTCQKYASTNYFISLKNPAINEAHNAKHKNNSVSFGEVMTGVVLPAAVQGVASAQNAKAEKEQEKMALKEQQKLKRERNTEMSKQYVQGQRQRSELRQYSMSTPNNVNESYNDLLTSDPDRNRAIQMSVQRYGVTKTRELVKQGRLGVSTSPRNNAREVFGVTASGQQIKLRVQDTNNGPVVIAYRNSGPSAQESWISVQSEVQYTKFQYDGEKSRDYKYKFSWKLLGESLFTTIYFN